MENYTVLNQRAVEKVKDALPEENEILSLAEFYKVLGDPTRLSLLTCLQHHELCVSDLCTVVQMSRSAVSHQLRLLKSAKLVRSHKEGKTVFYALDDEHIRNVIQLALDHIRE